MCNGYVYVTIFLEIDHSFNEATALILKPNEKKEHLQVCFKSLTMLHTRQKIIREGKPLAVRHKLESLQANMEILYLSIKKRQTAIQSSASK